MDDDKVGTQARTEKQHAFRGGLWLGASQIIPLIGTTALSVVIGRFLGADQLGLQSYINYVQALLVSLLFYALTTATVQAISSAVGAKDDELFARLSRWSVLTNSLGGLVAGLVLMVFGLFSATPLPWFLVALTALTNGIGWGFGAIAIARDGWSRVAARRLVTQCLSMALGIALVLAGFGINGVFVAALIAAVVTLVLLVRLCGKIRPGVWMPFPAGLSRLWGPFVLMEALSQIVTQRMEFLFLGAYSTDVEIAAYSIPFMVIAAVSLIPQSVVSAGMPHVARSAGSGDVARSADAMSVAIRVVAIFSVPLTAAVASVGPSIIIVLYGPDFKQSALLLPLMALCLLTSPIGALYVTFWSGSGRLRIPLIATAIAGVIDLGLAWLLVPHLNALGAALANLAGQTTMSILMLVMTARATAHFPIPVLRWLGVLLFSVVVGAVTFAVTDLVGMTSSVQAILACIAGMVVFLIPMIGFGYFVGFVDHSDGHWLRDTVPSRLSGVVRLLAGRHSSPAGEAAN